MSASVRRRRRTVEERIGAQLRHGKPGDLAGRGEPLKRDRGAIVSRAGGPSGGDSGTVIEHLTMEAVAGQTIATGGGTVQWGTILAPPTERRGFRTASATLAADGAVGDIPIDVTGDLEITLDGRWGDYPDGFKGSGDLVITRTRSGATATKTISLTPAARRICPPNEIAWDVRAGDTITVTLPNDSGSDQTLAELELRLRVIEVASATSTVRAAGDVHVYVSSDNDSVVYLDETQVVSAASGDANAVTTLGAGEHVVAIKGTNLSSASPNPAYVQLAIYDYADGTDGALLFTTNLADWDCQDYPGADPAGWPDVGDSAETWTPVYEQSTAGFDPLPEPSALKIWSRADATSQPVGTSYFRGVFTL